MSTTSFEDVEAEFEALDDWDDRYRLLIELGRALPAMPAVLKTDATRVRGCASQVWLHPRRDGDRLFFAADSDAAIVKGLVALVLMLADGRAAGNIDPAAIRDRLDGLGLSRHHRRQSLGAVGRKVPRSAPNEPAPALRRRRRAGR